MSSADHVFVGGAPAVFDQWTLTLANTWAAADIGRITIGNKDLLVTVNSATLEVIRDELVASFNAATFENPTPATGFTRNVGGQQILEFTEAVASPHPSETAKVLITATVAGVPLGVTSGETTAGSGTLAANNTTPATGPNHVNNPDNWLSGSLPIDTDTIGAMGAVDMLYGLDYFQTAPKYCPLVLDLAEYTGQIGLNPFNARGYAEYRTRHLVLYSSIGNVVDTSIFSSSPANVSGKPMYLQLGDFMGLVSIAGGRGNGSPNIFIKGGSAASGFQLVGGALRVDDTSFASDITLGDGSNNYSIGFGPTCVLTGVTNFKTNGGNVLLQCPTQKGGGGTQPTMEIHGTAVVTLRLPAGLAAYSHRKFAVFNGATLKPEQDEAAGTADDVTVYNGGTVDATLAPVPQNFDDVYVYGGGTVKDPRGHLAAKYQFVGGAPTDNANNRLPPNKKYTVAAVS